MSESNAIDVSGDGGIRKEIIKEGSGNVIPPKAKAKVHYVGTLEDGSKFDSSRDRGDPFSFSLGAGQVIKGWDLGVATMKQGEISKLICQHEYAYGESGSPPTIPPKATLNFEVELLGWDDPEPDTLEECIKAATKRKEEGNELYKKEQYTEAIHKYKQAIKYFEQHFSLSKLEEKNVNEIKLPCLLNAAVCQLKLKEYSDAILSCHKALDIDQKNLKALFRRAQGYAGEKDFDAAKADLLESIKIAPNNKEVRQELETLKKSMEAYKKQQQQMFGGLFEKMAKAEIKEGGEEEKKEETKSE